MPKLNLSKTRDTAIYQKQNLSLYDSSYQKKGRGKSQETDEQEFPYGWRYVKQTSTNGCTSIRKIPLTLEDLLNPQLGDQLPESNKHFKCNVDLFGVFYTRYRNDPTTEVFGDLIFKWGIPNLEKPAPDVAIVKNSKNKDDYRPSFDVLTEGTRPSLIIEIVSPSSKENDLDKKVKIYQQAQVEEYFIVDPHLEQGQICYEINGYRLIGKSYRKIKPDEQGRVFSQSTQVLLGVNEQLDTLRLWDANTEEEILLTREEIEEARLEAQRRAEAAEARAKEAEVRATEAEACAATEAAARASAEARIKALEEQLRKYT